jgi:hypothetical protein
MYEGASYVRRSKLCTKEQAMYDCSSYVRRREWALGPERASVGSRWDENLGQNTGESRDIAVADEALS